MAAERIIPNHIAIILDGNGRWAKAKGLPRNAGHVQGAKTVEVICEEAYKMGVQYLTVYAFSTENWNRPKDEVDALMKLLRNYMKNWIQHNIPPEKIPAAETAGKGSFIIAAQDLLEFEPVSCQIQNHVPGAFFQEAVAGAGDDDQFGILVDPAELMDMLGPDVAVFLAVEDQYGDIVGNQGQIVPHFLITFVGDGKAPLAGPGEGGDAHGLQCGLGDAAHGQDGLVHDNGRSLHHQLDLAGQFQQVIQADQGQVGTKTGGENTQVFHLRVLLPGVGGHCHEGLDAVCHREIIHGAFGMTGQVETQSGRVEQFHFLSDAGLDSVDAAAAQTMNTQNDPSDIAEIRLRLTAEDVDPVAGQDEFFLHVHHLFIILRWLHGSRNLSDFQLFLSGNPGESPDGPAKGRHVAALVK